MYKPHEKWRFPQKHAGGLLVGIFAAALATVIPNAIATEPDGVQQNPLSLEQMLRVPSLQLSADFSSASIGNMQVRGTTLGRWEYSVAYRYTSSGWQVDRYSVRPLPQGQTGQDDSRYRRSGHSAAGEGSGYGTNLIQVPPVLPPGPGIIPKPDEPDNPEEPSKRNFTACPLVHGIDSKYEWDWVPTHEETNEYGDTIVVPGHWELKGYTIGFSPQSFCK